MSDNQIKIKAAPMPEKDIGIDTDNTLTRKLISGEGTGLDSGLNSYVDLSVLEGFTKVSRHRENIYDLIDTMSQDSTIASVLETYAEDAVETNENGKIVWAESSNPDIAKYVTYLLDTMNVDKYIYSWVYSLIKYGDLYLRIYRESDYSTDEIFTKPAPDMRKYLTEEISQILAKDFDKEEVENNRLDEKVYVNVSSANDKYVHYLEAVQNPGEMFELVKFGKTMGYVKAPVSSQKHQQGAQGYGFFQYRMNRQDVTVYEAGDFVHASLENNSSRTAEEVQIFVDNDDPSKTTKANTYTVRRGQSLLDNLFKTWRELSLLENSVLLNRLTKSSIVRMIQVEVGDMGKEDVLNHLRQIKGMVEQKSAIKSGEYMSEYTNPGPIENNIYIPIKEGKGAISSQQIGGDVDVKSLIDLEYFRDKLFAALRSPKQFFGFTDDATGFNGGSSLSIISSRYGKAVKRIQNSMLQALTDAINLMLLDKNLTNYINKFNLRITSPLTQEEIDRRESQSNKMRIVSDVMSQLNDIETTTTRLKILKSLLTTVIPDSEIIELIQEEIDLIEVNEMDEEEILEDSDEDNEEIDIDLPSIPDDIIPGDDDIIDSPDQEEFNPFGEEIIMEESLDEETIDLPSGDQLEKDFTKNSYTKEGEYNGTE